MSTLTRDYAAKRGSSNDAFVEAELTSSAKVVVGISIASILFLSQIALNIGEFPVSTDLVAYGFFATYLLFAGYGSLCLVPLFLFTAIGALGVFRIPFAGSNSSWTSLLLLVALYAPYCFRLPRQIDLGAVQKFIRDFYVSALIVLAAISFVQIILVNIGASWFTNIHFVLPEAIRSAGTYTYTREGAGFIKANGFFLKESSTLSLVMALGVFLEYHGRARKYVLGILAAALLCSFSGSGILGLIAGVLLPRSLSRTPNFIMSAGAFAFSLFVVASADIPGINIWLDRLSEFSTPNTSGYARFVAPLEMLSHNFSLGALYTWFGSGPGSYLRETSLLNTGYEINDPTWSKLSYEYGFVGFVLVCGIFAYRVYSSSLRVDVANFFLFTWITSGLVLKSDFVFTVWLLTLVPVDADTYSKAHLEGALLSSN